MDWVRMGTARSGYLLKKTGSSGTVVELGWSHATLAGLLRESGFSVEAGPLTPENILAALVEGKLVVASVSYELGTNRPITRKGGHLVVVTGASRSGFVPLTFLLHNPSGRTADLRENARVPIHRFRRAYARRAIVVWKERTHKAHEEE
jgi:hypothetical protein